MPTTFQIPEHVKSVIDQDGAVLLDVRQGKYFSLNPIALEIWQQISAGKSVEDIEATLIATFDAAPEIIRQDLADCISHLKTGKLINEAR